MAIVKNPRKNELLKCKQRASNNPDDEFIYINKSHILSIKRYPYSLQLSTQYSRRKRKQQAEIEFTEITLINGKTVIVIEKIDDVIKQFT